jgi:hypothetical protein
LVVSTRLRKELIELAREIQGDPDNPSPEVQPNKINQQVARWTVNEIRELDPIPRYIRPDGYRREYLIHTAILGQAEVLITDDDRLFTDGETMHSDATCDATSGRVVQPYWLHDFVGDRLPKRLAFDEIDAPAVLRAALRVQSARTVRARR